MKNNKRLDKYIQEKLLQKRQDKYFVPCFYYLLETRSFRQDVYNTAQHNKTNEEFISVFIDGCIICEKDAGYSRVSFECLMIFKDILETITQLFNTNQLHILEPYGLINTHNEK